MTSFVAYIDESGDEGFVFLPREQGSSRWLVLSAVVFRKSRDLEAVSTLKRVRETINKPTKAALHFRELRHEQRIPYARAIGDAPVRTVSVAIYKPSLQSPENYQQEGHRLYRYASRLLLERVSWLCRDSRAKSDGDGTVDLVFSNRSAMSYDDLRSYLQRLQRDANCRIEWGVIVPDRVRAVNHDQLAGLQMADAVASGTYYALNKNQYGECESRYLELFASRIYRRRGGADGYGMKFWPNFKQLKRTLDHLPAIERFVI